MRSFFLTPMLRRWATLIRVSAPRATASVAHEFALRYSNPPGLWKSSRLSQLVEVQGARMIYLSGQTPTDANYKVRDGDFRAQIDTVYDNIETALRSVGAGLENIVKTTTYITDPEDIGALREARVARYKNLGAAPANTLLVVSRLAEPEFLIEIDVIAAVPAN
jgi:enamine deaminase RidA (YjgF/YER057c/UK114 family)